MIDYTGKYIRYIQELPSQPPAKPIKTRVWHVRPVADDWVSLGYVKWSGPWRCYAFYPQPGTVFEKQCLMDLAEFCKSRTEEHRADSRMLLRKRKDADLLSNHRKRSFDENPSG